MRRSFILSALIAVSPLLIFSTCGHNENDRGCRGDELCTMEFAMVTTKVVDANGAAVKLDEAFTLPEGAYDTVKAQQDMPGEGTYTVLDDSYHLHLKNKKMNFTFKGVKDGKEVVSERFVISGDCCHITKQEGPATITIK